jgi:hypothetical protein
MELLLQTMAVARAVGSGHFVLRACGHHSRSCEGGGGALSPASTCGRPDHPRPEDDGEVVQMTGAANLTRTAEDARWWRPGTPPPFPPAVSGARNGGGRGLGAAVE